MKKIFFAAIVIAGATVFLAYSHRFDKVFNNLSINQPSQKDIASFPIPEAAIAKPVKANTIYMVCDTTKVTDGDSINVTCNGEKLKIRFCGIDAPESKQPLGRESKALLSKFVGGKQVLISPIEKDRYGRTVAEVEVKGDKNSTVLVNAQMVKSGMAYHYKQYSDSCPNREAIAQAEDFANGKNIGVWGGDFQKPWDYRKAQRAK